MAAMPVGSRHYQSLKLRLAQLRQLLLGFLPEPPVSKTSYSAHELEASRAYVLLAHAEIEHFCETIAFAKVQAAKARFDSTGHMRPILRRLVLRHVIKKNKSWSDVRNPKAMVSPALDAYKEVVQSNHGVKSRNLENLLFPLGVLDRQLNGTWLAQMDSFGSVRGSIAHGSNRVQKAPDPLTELTAVNQLMPGLLDLDRLLSRLR